MKLAVFADIHSNYHAFRACLEDARNHGAQGFVLLGDFVSDLPWPRRTMDLIYDLQSRFPCWCVRGNREDYMLRVRSGEETFSPGSKSGSLLHTWQELRPEDLDFFESLPIYRKIRVDGVMMELAHAEKGNNRHVIGENDPYLDVLFENMETDLLLVGHSHRQFLCQKGGKTILNPGSLGIPQGRPGYAQYALVTTDCGIRCRLMEAAYDVPAVIREQYESGLAALAPFWAVSILNNIISGENPMLALLERVEARGGFSREEIWEQEAVKLNLAAGEQALLCRWKEIQKQQGGLHRGCPENHEDF